MVTCLTTALQKAGHKAVNFDTLREITQRPDENAAQILARLTEGIVWVHIPFSLSDLSQIKKRLGSFSSDPDTYLKEFKYLTHSYDLTWHDIYTRLSSTLLLEEEEQVCQASQAHAMKYIKLMVLNL